MTYVVPKCHLEHESTTKSACISTNDMALARQDLHRAANLLCMTMLLLSCHESMH